MTSDPASGPAGGSLNGPVSGTWFVVATSLPFWRRRSAPGVTYAPLPDGRVLDAVHYRSRGADRLVLGADTPAPDGTWHWRGLTPLTRLTSSTWRVLAFDEDPPEAWGRWAVTAFEKTLFTPAGVDVYCRAERIGDEARAAAIAALGADPGLAGFVPRLFDPAR
ncbi:hypothetical protein H5V45_03585 [Nocardioides sp. KIGAM211]|uniref:Uncharacterized protein n=1 Tax=Nocardioides luti TaxID=2761101 RepID=A0A7X0V9W5_9ACTN|nr:hypothetical protein [Nocardioides luti]MBB6626397.1 hypothetical protein [Nocardioides luti]